MAMNPATEPIVINKGLERDVDGGVGETIGSMWDDEVAVNDWDAWIEESVELNGKEITDTGGVEVIDVDRRGAVKAPDRKVEGVGEVEGSGDVGVVWGVGGLGALSSNLYSTPPEINGRSGKHKIYAHEYTTRSKIKIDLVPLTLPLMIFNSWGPGGSEELEYKTALYS
jgi:hypothetical protein